MPASAATMIKTHQPPTLFVIVTSQSTQARAYDAFSSWCTDAVAAGSECRFVADLPYTGKHGGRSYLQRAPPGMHWIVQPPIPSPPSSCCRGGKGFFCSEHRRRTLSAQYRYLPALALARQLEPFASGRAQWVVLLDDDSFVFVRRLLRFLGRQYRRPHQHPIMLGEFKPDRSYACGGAGAVLSRAALLRLDLQACIARTRRRCMQSDWQLGDCVRRAKRDDGRGAAEPHGVAAGVYRQSHRQSSGTAAARAITLESAHGCGSCADASATVNSSLARLRAGCHFMQEAGAHARWLLQTLNCSSHRVSSPSIVHGGKVVSPAWGLQIQTSKSLAAMLAQRHRSASRATLRECEARHRKV